MIARCCVVGVWLLVGQLSFADSFLVREGVAKSEIVIGKNPPRTVHLAAQELQRYVGKMTGATLEIVTSPARSGEQIKIYVGESDHTKELGIDPADLKHGAYRIFSDGESWLALIGQDTDFNPIEPWPRGNSDVASGKMQEEWDRITGANWGYMHRQMHKHYSGRNALFGTENEQKTDEDGNINVWTYDERGSFNAVCGFLRGLGVRWYMPGEVGEILPEMESIPLAKIDETVHPDFPMRILNFRPAVYGREAMMWGFRLGVRQPYGRQAAHGLHGMTDNEWTLENKPEWFALYGGQRHNQSNVKNNQLCYSNEELFQEAVRFARTQLDHFNMDVVSIMPPDGYTAICQCEKCEGKESPELGPRGHLSNYVWDFVNRVAKEVGKTHPDKRISNCAYGVYTEAPNNIRKLEPNLQVIIVGGRRPLQEDREDLRRLRSDWAALTDHPIEIFENYPFTGRGWYLPTYIPRVLGESINETKGTSRGEDIWLTMDFSENAIGFNHFLLYFTGRMYWGGREADPVALFEEYVQKFYEPVAPEMQAFFSYCEDHWRSMEKDGEKAVEALNLFQKAKEKVPSGTVFEERVELVDTFLNRLRVKAEQLSQKRGPIPTLRLVSGAEQRGKIVVDGKLDDEPWQKIPSSSTASMRELQTGEIPTFQTQVKTEWIGRDLYFGIRCDEMPGQPLNITAEKDGDQAIFYGDTVEVLLSTNAHQYYQIVVNPAGAMIDLDRGAPKNRWLNWSSKAEVATHIADDHWTVEMRLPITQDENDPLHQVIGRKPTVSLPWFINVCRQRIRENASEYSAFSPTGQHGFHFPIKFGRLYAGNSAPFEFDPTVTDFIIARKSASDLMRSRKWQEAMSAWDALAGASEVTEFQRSKALQQAATCAVNAKQFEQAEAFAASIPLKAIAMTSRMQLLAAQREWEEIVRQFGGEDLTAWPFWQIGEAAFVRGKAFHALKKGAEADSDFRLALSFEPDEKVLVSLRLLTAQNLEMNLGDDAEALILYQKNLEGRGNIGGADEFRSADRAATILAKKGRFDDALAVFQVVNFEKTKGYWLQEMRLSKSNALIASGKSGEAEKLLREVGKDASASNSQRERAVEMLER